MIGCANLTTVEYRKDRFVPYYSQPLTIRGVVWVTRNGASDSAEGHVEFSMYFPDRDHCTLRYSREDTPETQITFHIDQMEAIRAAVAVALAGCALIAPPE
jgi:hypothetical protein